MPFGAEVLESGAVRFNLWAPTAGSVSLCLEEGEGCTPVPMPRGDDGWFTLVTDVAGHGSRYRYRINDDLLVPDPASRFQPDDVHGASLVVDPRRYRWGDRSWRGRPWEEMVVYELHVGCFTAAGTFAAVTGRLDHLAELGVTAIELMPIAAFPGRRNWGYDSTLFFAPATCYGGPDALKQLVEAAHARNLMVLLDVVYNHFGPEGNYLHRYAASFFTERFRTPWGWAINFSGRDSYWVRQFSIHNALYWLEEFQLDGLRLDAVHAIRDPSSPHILEELAQQVRSGPGRERHIHLVLENDSNQARHLSRDAENRPLLYNGQWNDDFHHALHVLLTGEQDGYYRDYVDEPRAHLGRCLGEGFAYQGEPSPYRGGAPRGEPSGHLPLTAFVNFIQNHDQTGNRALGERISALTTAARLEAAVAILLLSPSPPLLFMGEEWGTGSPFLFFCDFPPELAKKVRSGRRREFARFPAFHDPAMLERIPDPAAPETFAQAVLNWPEMDAPRGRQWLRYYASLLTLRHQHLMPRLAGIQPGGRWRQTKAGVLEASWSFADGARLLLLANLADLPAPGRLPCRDPLFRTPSAGSASNGKEFPPWSVYWFLEVN